MNLTDLLSGSVISSIAGQTGTSEKDTQNVLANALPALVGAMAQNASTEDGANSLAKALDDHTSSKGLASLLQNVDTEDGAKILTKILGGETETVRNAVAKKSGASKVDTSKILAMAAPLLLAFNAVNNLFGVGSSSMMSRSLGKKDYETVYRSAAFGFYCSIFAGLLFSIAYTVFQVPLLNLLGATEETLGATIGYARWTVTFGAVPAILNVVLAYLVRAEGAAMHASIGTMSGCFLNILLDPIFILPWGLNMGAEGAGLATFLSNCVACLFFLTVLIRMGKGSIITFNPRVGLPQKESIFTVFAVGIPSAIASFLFDMDYVIIDKLMVSYNDLALAAVGIVLKVERFPLNVGIGICQGMMPLVAYNYSAGNEKRMNDTVRLSRRLGLGVAAVSILLYELFAPEFSRLFISEAETVALASQFLRIRVLATPLMFLSFFTVYLFQAFGKGRISLFLGVTRWLVFNIPMLFLLNAIFGMYGIVWSQAIADILTVALSFFMYFRYRPRF